MHTEEKILDTALELFSVHGNRFKLNNIIGLKQNRNYKNKGQMKRALERSRYEKSK